MPYSISHHGKLSITFAEEAHVASLEWHRDDLFRCPNESASIRNLRWYDLKVGEKEMDLLQVMMQKKEEIDALILETVNSMWKWGWSKNSHYVIQGHWKIWKDILFSKASTVYFEGIAGDQYLELIKDMVDQVKSFYSHGSGWTIDRIEKLQINFAAFAPKRAGSYLELSDAVSAASALLTNINTKDDNRCFLYCFVAAYHNIDELALYTTLEDGWRKTKF